jgi:hypothetical protein
MKILYKKLNLPLKRLIWLILILSFTSVMSSIANAQSNPNKQNKVILYLESISYNKSVKDKIFIHITEYSNIEEPTEYRLPTYPKHWLTKELGKLKDIVLWQGRLKNLENKSLVVSLVDHDNPPLDSNEPLGSVRLNLTNDAYKGIISNWEDADFDEPIKIEKITDLDSASGYTTFKLTNEKNEYILNFFTKISK